MMVAGLLIGLSASATAKPWMQLGQDLHGDEIGDLFGCSVSLSSNGTTALIGGPHNDKNGDNSGHARVYDWDGTLWVQRGADILGRRDKSYFGGDTALSADGNTTLIMAEDYFAVYTWDPATKSWKQRGARIEDGSKGALSQDGNTALIAKPLAGFRSPEVTWSGLARIYVWDGAKWIQRGSDILGTPGNRFGWSVSLSSDGKTASIGGVGATGGKSVSNGVVRVYDWDGRNWKQRGIDIYGSKLCDFFGLANSISSDGNSIAIGAPCVIAAKDKSGYARVYDWNGKEWVQRGVDLVGEPMQKLGRSVDLSDDGNTLLVGAHGTKGRLYDWDGKAWVQRGPDIDSAGASVSLSADGRTALIGSPGGLKVGDPIPSAGIVRVFR